MVIITLPDGRTIAADSPEEAARVIKALDGARLPPDYSRQFKGSDYCTCGSYGTWMSVLPPPPCPAHGGGHCKVTCHA